MPAHSEIHAPRRVVLRYQPRRPFPPYRYVPGLQPHPMRDPTGHSYEPRQQSSLPTEWNPAGWRSLSDWLWGVDLFNAFYFWEAHEAWERLWASKPKTSIPALMLQGLIQIAAALLQTHLGSLSGASNLARNGLDKLARAANTSPTLLGLDLNHTITNFRDYFHPLAKRILPPLDASVPVLLLVEGGDT